MDSLTSAPVADVLARLFDKAQEIDGPLDERFAKSRPTIRRSPNSLFRRPEITKACNPDNDYRTVPLPFGAHRGNEMSVRTA